MAALLVEEMLPALAQGAVGLEIRAGDRAIRDLVAAVNDEATAVTVAAERGFLSALDGSCRTPIAGHARLVDNGDVELAALIATQDGTRVWRTSGRAARADGPHLGRQLGEQLRRDADPGIFADWPVRSA